MNFLTLGILCLIVTFICLAFCTLPRSVVVILPWSWQQCHSIGRWSAGIFILLVELSAKWQDAMATYIRLFEYEFSVLSDWLEYIISWHWLTSLFFWNLLFWGMGGCRVFLDCREWGQSWGALRSTRYPVSGLFIPSGHWRAVRGLSALLSPF